MTLSLAYAAFSRWQSSDYTDTEAAAILSDIVGWDVAERYADPLTDTVFWDGELEEAVLNF
jgi:hypothetical protein